MSKQTVTLRGEVDRHYM